MINQNARRTGAAGVMARALGTLGAATLLLTSTGWGALAGNTGFGGINLKAYQGAAAAVPGPSTGDAAKAGGDDILAEQRADARYDAMRRDLAEKAYYEEERRLRELRLKPLEKLTPTEAIDLWDQWAKEWAPGGDGSGTTTAPAAGSGSSVGGSNPTTGSAPGPGSSVASSGPTTATTAARKALDDAKDAAYAAQADYQAALDEKTAVYFAYKYDHLTLGQSAAIARAGGYQQYMAMLEQNIDALDKKVEQAWAAVH
jgi:hypothetical protein